MLLSLSWRSSFDGFFAIFRRDSRIFFSFLFYESCRRLRAFISPIPNVLFFFLFCLKIYSIMSLWWPAGEIGRRRLRSSDWLVVVVVSIKKWMVRSRATTTHRTMLLIVYYTLWSLLLAVVVLHISISLSGIPTGELYGRSSLSLSLSLCPILFGLDWTTFIDATAIFRSFDISPPYLSFFSFPLRFFTTMMINSRPNNNNNKKREERKSERERETSNP